jgi:hypothetical protein
MLPVYSIMIILKLDTLYIQIIDIIKICILLFKSCIDKITVILEMLEFHGICNAKMFLSVQYLHMVLCFLNTFFFIKQKIHKLFYYIFSFLLTADN